ncbi:Mu transposase C-terminal domain-containing protein [Cellulosilyticum sp. I15G10I2]|uniref:Mu transposase C-terminal domain-containing protein n=1 Tax=Cellulosilyticum sp. I15G10I2 TaxID=1892843 RepID=UPI00085C9C6A|nr:Mu transposase C-terminal domain-containing protein [Cellulosilyticum sp. I15G10I2]
MDDIYVTLDDAAILENTSYEAMKKKIQRQSTSFKTKTEENTNGGKERVLISLTSLSTQARRKYKSQQVQKEKANSDEVAWYVYTDINWYKERFPQHFFEAVEVARYIEKYLGKELEMTAGEFKTFLANKYGVSAKTIQRRVTDYIEADAVATIQELNTGENYGHYRILACARKPKEDNTFPSLKEEVKVFIENLYYDETFSRNLNSTTNLYEDLLDAAEDKGWTVPSYDTVLRYVKYLNDQDGEGVKALAARGLRYWRNQYMIKRRRNLGALQPLEVVQGDAHTFDCWVRVKRANGSYQAIRPMLVAWIDMRTRCLVGWVVCECPDASIIKQSIISMVYPKENKALPYGVPKYLLIDNGKDFTAQTLTGRARTERFTFDEDTEGFFRCVGIQDDMRSIPYQPWSKAQVERFFGRVCGQFTKRIASYTGTLTGSKTSSKVVKDIEGMLERGELMPIEEFAELFEKWVVERYHARRHQGLIEQGENTPAPISVFNSVERYFMAPPPIDVARAMLMEGSMRVIRRSGIQITFEGKKIYYQNELLANHEGEKVQFKYHPNDVTRVKIYDMSGDSICEAVSHELLLIAPKLSEAGLVEHLRDQKRTERRTKDTLRYRRASAEERKELNLEDAGKKVVAPQIDIAAQKVSAIVTNNRYITDKKAAKKQKEEAITHSEIKKSAELQNDYWKRKADEVFAQLG